MKLNFNGFCRISFAFSEFVVFFCTFIEEISPVLRLNSYKTEKPDEDLLLVDRIYNLRPFSVDQILLLDDFSANPSFSTWELFFTNSKSSVTSLRAVFCLPFGPRLAGKNSSWPSKNGIKSAFFRISASKSSFFLFFIFIWSKQTSKPFSHQILSSFSVKIKRTKISSSSFLWESKILEISEICNFTWESGGISGKFKVFWSKISPFIEIS